MAAKKLAPLADELVTSPMVSISLYIPKALVESVDRLASDDDPSAPNRSSVVRRAIIAHLRRLEAA
jgi:metal-responsive CopG/Arc/MetJ family transcriptional regulator